MHNWKQTAVAIMASTATARAETIDVDVGASKPVAVDGYVAEAP